MYSARNMLQFFTIPLGYLAGGFLVDSMFEPFMTDKSNTVLNQLFGTGKGSGAAFLFAVIGVMGQAGFPSNIRVENLYKSLLKIACTIRVKAKAMIHATIS